MARILVGAADGLHVFEDGREGGLEHAGRGVTALARDGEELWAILDRREVRRTVDGRWSPGFVSSSDASMTCLAATRAGTLVGLSEARLVRVGETTGLETVAGFGSVEGRDGWSTPWGGPPDTRSIAEDEDAVYVNVHVGGIPRSRDGGTTWEPTIDVDADVHRVWAGEVGVLAAGAHGLSVSRNGGDTWELRSDGLHARYCRAVALCSDTVMLSASTGPRSGRAALYRGSLRGGPFEKCTTGLPEWFGANIDSAWLDASSELAAFGTEDGRVFASTDEGASWAEVASRLPPISCVIVVGSRPA